MANSSQRLSVIAYHEAGHAVLALHYQRRLKQVSIIPGQHGRGQVIANPGYGSIEGDITLRKRSIVEEWVRIQLAGHIAQQQHAPKSQHLHDGRVDRANAVDLLERITRSQEEVTAYLKLLRIQTEQLVKQPLIWARITAVAEALLSQRTLSGDEVRDIGDQAVRVKLEELAKGLKAHKQSATK